LVLRFTTECGPGPALQRQGKDEGEGVQKRAFVPLPPLPGVEVLLGNGNRFVPRMPYPVSLLYHHLPLGHR